MCVAYLTIHYYLYITCKGKEMINSLIIMANPCTEKYNLIILLHLLTCLYMKCISLEIAGLYIVYLSPFCHNNVLYM